MPSHICICNAFNPSRSDKCRNTWNRWPSLHSSYSCHTGWYRCGWFDIRTRSDCSTPSRLAVFASWEREQWYSDTIGVAIDAYTMAIARKVECTVIRLATLSGRQGKLVIAPWLELMVFMESRVMRIHRYFSPSWYQWWVEAIESGFMRTGDKLDSPVPLLASYWMSGCSPYPSGKVELNSSKISSHFLRHHEAVDSIERWNE
jgi:hypothetical protein